MDNLESVSLSTHDVNHLDFIDPVIDHDVALVCSRVLSWYPVLASLLQRASQVFIEARASFP